MRSSFIPFERFFVDLKFLDSLWRFVRKNKEKNWSCFFFRVKNGSFWFSSNFLLNDFWGGNKIFFISFFFKSEIQGKFFPQNLIEKIQNAFFIIWRKFIWKYFFVKFFEFWKKLFWQTVLFRYSLLFSSSFKDLFDFESKSYFSWKWTIWDWLVTQNNMKNF